MRILILGANVASQMSITVRALRRVGVDADGAVYGTIANYSTEGLRQLEEMSRLERLRRGYLRTSWSWTIASSIVKCDVVHWNYGVSAWGRGYDLRLAHLLGRPGIVEFWGSDVRIAELAAERSVYYARRGSGYEYEKEETRAGSYQRQELFANNGVRECFAPPWFDQYLKPSLFRATHHSFLRVLLDELTPAPASHRRKPVVAHAPSARGAKGTDMVLAVVERLRRRIDFEFVLLHGLSRREVLDQVRACDVFLDQFVIGEYGMASVEAMAFAKPVVCYLRPDVIDQVPGRIPIVNASPDDLEDKLAELLTAESSRTRIGEESRQYVEDYHDAEAYARRLVPVYERLVAEAR